MKWWWLHDYSSQAKQTGVIKMSAILSCQDVCPWQDLFGPAAMLDNLYALCEQNGVKSEKNILARFWPLLSSNELY